MAPEGRRALFIEGVCFLVAHGRRLGIVVVVAILLLLRRPVVLILNPVLEVVFFIVVSDMNSRLDFALEPVTRRTGERHRVEPVCEGQDE